MAASASESTESSEKKFTFFWKSGSPFSQWHPSKFTVDGVTFGCAEQFMMYQKAVLFEDQAMADKIMKSTSPRGQKSLGRKVRNFQEKMWSRKCREIVMKGNLAKFEQNPKLKEALMATGDTLLVEASPRDTIWGIGLSESDPCSQDISTWRGTNLLGYILTDVRTELAKKTDT